MTKFRREKTRISPLIEKIAIPNIKCLKDSSLTSSATRQKRPAQRYKQKPPGAKRQGGKKTERLTFPIQAKNHGYLFFFIIFTLWATSWGSSTTPRGISARNSESARISRYCYWFRVPVIVKVISPTTS